MKLAVIADIHGNYRALETVLAELDGVNADKTWVLGDLAAHGPRPAECVTKIRELHEADKENFLVIGGNTDRYLVRNSRMARKPATDAEAYQQYIEQYEYENETFTWGTAQLGWENYEFLSKILGREVSQNVEGYGIVMGYHAIPGDDEYRIDPDTPDEEALDSVLDRPLRLGVYGHIHRQVNRDLGRVRLVNPGSVGLSFEAPGKAQYAVLTFDGGRVEIDLREVPYDVNAAVADLDAAGHPHPQPIAQMMTEGVS